MDAGLLAETLFFYEHVHLLMDGATLGSLLRSIGPDTLIRLLRDKRMTVTFLADSLGTVTSTNYGLSRHNYAAFKIARDADGKKISSKDWVRRSFIKTLENQYGVGRSARRFTEQISFREHGDEKIVDAARSDLDDSHYVQESVRLILMHSVPGLILPNGWFFRTLQMNEGDFVVDTNLRFDALNVEYHKQVPIEANSITPAWILTQILDARADLSFAADYMAEYATDPLHSDIAKLQFSNLLKRRLSSGESIAQFQKVELNNARAIREAINSGERSFDDFLHLLDKAGRFKKWLQQRNPDANLIGDYIRASTEDTWAEHLPMKAVHFAAASIVGTLLTPAAALGLGFADSMFADRLIRGWRPNQFIQGAVRKFVGLD